jgi:integrase
LGTTSKVSKADIAETFFHWLEKEWIAYPSKYPELALSVFTWFCGIRVEEVTNINWSGLNKEAEHLGDLEKKDFSGWEITVWGDQEKTSTSKVNPVPDNAKDWLQLCLANGEFTKDRITEPNWRKRKSKLWSKFKKETEIKLPQNTGRHSFTSHHLALYGDSPLTALRLGHPDPTTLYANYLAGLRSSEAKKYFSIIPKATQTRIEKEASAEAKAQAKTNIEAEYNSALMRSDSGKIVIVDGRPTPVVDEGPN